MEVTEPLYVAFFVGGVYANLVRTIVIPSIKLYEPALDLSREILFLHSRAPIEGQNHYDLAGQTYCEPYKELMRKRIQTYEEIVLRYEGHKVLFLDSDVIILGSFKQEILDYLDTYDFAMQDKYCAGIWGVNCNKRTIEFFRRFREIIDNIEPKDRADGYPQFELEDAISVSIKEKKLTVLELPRKYGYLCGENSIYHAMNGGTGVDAKCMTLMLATMMIMEMRQGDWGRWKDWEVEHLQNTASKETLVYICALNGSDMGRIKDIVDLDDGTSDWSLLPKSFQLPPYDLISRLDGEESVVIMLGTTFTPAQEHPRTGFACTKEHWTKWLQNFKS